MTKPKWYHYLLAASSQDPDNPSARMHSPLEEAKAYASNDKSKLTDIQNDQIEYDKKSGIAKGATAIIAASPLKNLAWKVMTHPVTEVVGTASGLYNLATDQGVEKTINHVKNNEYGKATLSALGDALDASPVLGVVKGVKAGYNALRNGENIGKVLIDNLPVTKFKRIFSKQNRAKHAFVTIQPFGYTNPFTRGVKWLNSVLADKPIDLNSATIDINKVTGLFKHLDGVDAWNKNREDAWRIYNGLEQKYNTYIKNADGTYRYNLEEVMKRRPDVEIGTEFYPSGGSHGYDTIGHNHGGLTGHTVIDVGDGKQVHYIEDVWDLHPFSRTGDHFSERYLAPVSKGVRTIADKIYTSIFNIGDGSYNILKKIGVSSPTAYKVKKNITYNPVMRALNKTRYMSDLSIPKFDKWLANIEAGTIIGGTPFTMKTRIPTKTISVDGNAPNIHHVYDDAVDYIIPKEPLQLKLNFNNIIKPQ